MSEQQRDRLEILYMIVSGAGSARRMPELAGKLGVHFEQTFIVPTENAHRVISQREFVQGDNTRIVDSYFDDAILPYPPEGVVLVAPCTFNSLNKLALGVADTLALSIAAEAIGRGTPVVVAVSVNPPLYAHPQTADSMRRLRAWGVHVIEPAQSERWMTLAADEDIVQAVLNAFASYQVE